MAKKFYQVTDTLGVVHKRSTERRTYTHATVTHYHPYVRVEGDENKWTRDTSKVLTSATWAGSLALAQKASNPHVGQEGIVKVEIIPAIETDRKGNPVTPATAT